jgi:N-glycosylase/DNA lyase
LEAAQGLRVLRYSNPIETIFTFLCTANNHVARISSLVRKLADFGSKHEGVDVFRFPSLQRLASISEEELRAAGFGYRAATLPLVAVELLARGGNRYVQDLKGKGYQSARKELMSIKSIGPKLADCICLFGLDFSEVVPVDTHIWQVARRLYFPQHSGAPLTQQKYEEFVSFFQKRFGEHAGWAHQALFFDDLVNWRSRKSASN